jgi:cytochrome c-type biogenesis protein CcmF
MGVRIRSVRLLSIGERAVIINFTMLFFSCILLISYFLSRDFSYKYVFENSDSTLPLIYTVSALWAGREGSLLIWALFISVFNTFVLSEKKDRLTAYTLIISSLFLVFLNILLLTTSNPFLRIEPRPEGFGLNPLLRTLEMVLHPPVLFISYAGFVIPFSMAVSGLILKESWIERTEKYLIVSWLFLGLGIFIGAWWAYRTLGWGGFWGWDPVENASFLPWLTSTALLHTMIVEKRGWYVKNLNYVLVVLTFSLIVLAAFITRSGFISSVHAFEKNPEGWAYLAFIIFILGFSTFVWYSGAGHQRIKGKLNENVESHKEPEKAKYRRIALGTNRETMILINVFLLSASLVTVLVGTVMPVLNPNLTVGPEYYESVEIPIGGLLILLLGLCIRISWKVEKNLKKFRLPVLISLISALSSYAIFQDISAVIGVGVFAFAILNHISGFYPGELRFLRKYGGYLTHFGVIFLFMGAMGIWMYGTVYNDVFITKGGSAIRDGMEFKLISVNIFEDEEKYTISTELQIFENGKLIKTTNPKQYIYKMNRPDRVVSSVEIIYQPFKDIYIAMSGVTRDFAGAGFEIHINPLASFVWLGMVLIITGGVYSLLHAYWRHN